MSETLAELSTALAERRSRVSESGRRGAATVERRPLTKAAAELLEEVLAQLRELGVPDGPCELRVSFSDRGLVRRAAVTHWSWPRRIALGRVELDRRAAPTDAKRTLAGSCPRHTPTEANS